MGPGGATVSLRLQQLLASKLYAAECGERALSPGANCMHGGPVCLSLRAHLSTSTPSLLTGPPPVAHPSSFPRGLPSAGEPIRVKSKDLPLHWFDLLFRRAGAALLFALWALRAAAAAAWPSAFPRGQGSTVGRAFVLYAVQAALRMVVYQLHVAGVPSPLTSLFFACVSLLGA